MAESENNPRFHCPLVQGKIDSDAYKRLWIPVQEFQCFYGATVNESGSTNYTEGVVLSADAGGPVLVEINSLGFVGAVIQAAGDALSTLYRVPHDMDVGAAANWYVAWCSSSTTTTDELTYKIHYNPIGTGEALGAGVSGTTLTATADPNDDTAYGYQETAAIAMAAAVWTQDDMVVLSVEADGIGTASAGEPYILGVIFEYRVRKLGGA